MTIKNPLASLRQRVLGSLFADMSTLNTRAKKPKPKKRAPKKFGVNKRRG